MAKDDNQTTPPAKPRLRQVVVSVLSAMFGVQKRDNLERDTSQRSLVPYIITAVILATVFVLILMGVATVASR